MAALRELGYTLGQGFHLAEPMTADGVSRLLARQQSVAPRASEEVGSRLS